MTSYRFIPSSSIDLPTQSHELKVRQQPQRAKMSVINERDRRPIEPPPILQVHWLHCSPDDIKKNLQCPFYFMVANIKCANSNELLSTQDYLAGSTVSSLHSLRDIDDTDGGFFIFGDLFCKKEGHYRLQFSLFEIVEGHVQNRQVITSEPFRTYMPKYYPGPVEATLLSQAFSGQGVKMRIRKEHRMNSGTARKRKLDVLALMDASPTKITQVTPRIAPAPASMGKHPVDYPSHVSYPSPTLFSSTSSISSTDEFPVTLLDEYRLQPLSHGPTTPPSTCFSPPQQHMWSEGLPALKAVMSGHTSRSAHLVLPCPFDTI